MAKGKVIGSVVFSALIFMLIAQTIHIIGSVIFQQYYVSSDYYYLWSKIMMPHPGPPPSLFYILSFTFNFIIGILLSIGYRIIKAGIPGTELLNKGLLYGLIIFIVGVIPGHLALILFINLPIALIVDWAAENLIIDLLGGIAIARINK